MSLLKSSSDHEVQRLLEMFPLATLKAYWPELKHGTKAELCGEIASQRNVKLITEFLATHVSCCKQHVYIRSREIKPKSIPSINLGAGTKIWEDGTDTLHVLQVVYDVSLANPVEEATLTFLWPVTVSWTDKHLIVRFVTLEKNVKTYFENRSPLLRSRSIDEEPVLSVIGKQAGNPSIADLHKGIKKLWADDFVDGIRVQYKKSSSTASEFMDPEKRIKECYPALYAELQKESWNYALFSLLPSKKQLSVKAFTVYPTEGRLGFSSFSKGQGDTDHVVREILRHN